MVEIKPNNYYLDKDRCLIYVHDEAIELHQAHLPSWAQLWRFTCLSTNKTHEMDLDSLKQIMVQDLGSTIAPAMRLLYGASNV